MLMAGFVGLSRAEDSVKLAFPGAVGHGRISLGGRGGAIIPVTTLEDSGPGSLRACVQATGPRNCVFRVGGIIHLQTSLGVEAENSQLSIWGETAPNPGITLTIGPVDQGIYKTAIFMRNASEVIIRNLRVRLQFQSTDKNADAFTIENSKRVYIDHVSGSWATDELISTYADATDITIANSIFAEGLLPHSKCVLMGSNPTLPQSISFWRNICISNNDRNPDVNHHGGSCIEIVNNIFFNARSEWLEVFSQFKGGTPVALVGNVFKAGPDTRSGTSVIKWQLDSSVSKPKIFESDNLIVDHEATGMTLYPPEVKELIVAEPVCPLTVPVGSAREIYGELRAKSGAFPRDKFDVSFIKGLGDFKRPGRGSIQKEPPAFQSTDESEQPYSDSDGDGMSDSWEALNAANPSASDAWEDSNGDGWSNFENFVSWLAEKRVEGEYTQ